MTELHANNLSERLREDTEAFDCARTAGNWDAAWKLWLRMLHAADTVIRESRANRTEADALACELLAYRPTRTDRPAAPQLPGYVYVFTGKQAWVCASVEARQLVRINALEKKTVCGKPVTFPVSERFISGGWPRQHELCPDCVKRLVGLGLLGQPVEPQSEK